jgi:hypothetical protein
MTIVWKGAHPNNYSIGRSGRRPEYIVLHWIVGTLESADATFQDPKRVASSHYGVGGTRIHQYVAEANTAYTNGNWDWNTRSITIEHEGGPNLPISAATYETSAWLIANIATRHNIPLTRAHIKGHRELLSTQCPGTLDIDRLIARAKQLQGGEEVTAEQHMKVIVQMLMDVLEGDPHYDVNKPDAFKAHVNRILTGPPLEERRFAKDILRYNNWTNKPPASNAALKKHLEIIKAEAEKGLKAA